MKKTFRFVGMFALCAVLMPAFTSCGDGDDGDEPEGSVDVPVIENEEGETVRLSSVAGYSLDYDSKGRLVQVSGKNALATIDYSKGTLQMEDDEDYENSKIKFTSKGYVSEITTTWDVKEDGYSYTGNGTCKFSYNDSGNLVSIVSTTKQTGMDDGEKMTYSGAETFTNTWKDGNLVSSSYKQEGTYNGYKITFKGTFELSYGSIENTYKQNPFCVTSMFFTENDVFMAMGAAGLYGVGPKYLPSSMTQTEQCEEDEEGEDTDYYTVSYTKNGIGAIATETFDGRKMNWSYEATKSVPMFTDFSVKKSTVRDLFKSKIRKK